MTQKRFKLSKKKQKWARQTKPTVALRGSALNFPVGVERRFVSDTRKIIEAGIRATEAEVKRVFQTPESKEYFAEDSVSSEAHAMLNRTFARIEKMTLARAKVAAERMVKGVDGSSKANIASSLKELSGGVTLKPIDMGGDIAAKLSAAIDVNVDLITRISSLYLSGVKDAVNRSIMLGNGLADLIPYLAKHKGISKRHAKNVALDQTRKAYTSLNLARMEIAGIHQFEWLHSGGGQKPRKYHQDRWPAGLNGGIFDVANPPIIDQKTGERGFPAQAYFCKCRMVPVLMLDNGEQLAA